MKHPEPYDGKQDLEVFDNWVNNVMTYAEVMKIRESTMIRLMLSYVTLGARGHLPSGYIVSSLRVLKQNTRPIPSGYMLSTFEKYPLKYPVGAL